MEILLCPGDGWTGKSRAPSSAIAPAHGSWRRLVPRMPSTIFTRSLNRVPASESLTKESAGVLPPGGFQIVTVTRHIDFHAVGNEPGSRPLYDGGDAIPGNEREPDQQHRRGPAGRRRSAVRRPPTFANAMSRLRADVTLRPQLLSRRHDVEERIARPATSPTEETRSAMTLPSTGARTNCPSA